MFAWLRKGSSSSSSSSKKTATMSRNPANFPRPPALERITRHLVVRWPNDGPVIADTKNAFWVLETYHPPTYYIPPADIKAPLSKTPRSSYCEWKGAATYYSIPVPEGVAAAGTKAGTVDNRAWSYETPTERFTDLKGCVSFYVGPWDCYVDGEKVVAQPGDFYGGWKTKDIDGSIKGGPGTLGW